MDTGGASGGGGGGGDTGGGSTQAVPQPLVQPCIDYATLQDGDTCQSIMEAYGLTLNAFNALNRFVDCGFLFPGGW